MTAMRSTLVLFDIDGTLVAGGPAKKAFHLALLETFGRAGPIDTHDFAGKTDPRIARELLQADGLSREEIDRGLPALFERYLAELELRLAEDPTRALPGVPALLEALSGEEDRIAVGLVTGNVVAGAALKLGAAGLPFFDVGGFGSDHENRNELPPVALRRAEAHWGHGFAPEQVVIVGDTPLDIECGRCSGTRTIGVATGKHDVDLLRECGADLVLPDLTETERVIDAFLDLRAALRPAP